MEGGSGYRNKDPSRLAELAARQHGVVATPQLEALGYTRWAVGRKVQAAELHRIHRAVYAVGHPRLTTKGQLMAAALACGPEAVLSHHAAAALWDLRPHPHGEIDVTAPGKRRHPGVRCHVSPLPAQYRTKIDGIPVTTLARTYVDYAQTAPARQLRAALEAGERRRLLDHRRLQETMAAHRGRAGLSALRAAVAELSDDPPWLQSELERDFRELLIASRLPLPSHNVVVAGELVDCAWPQRRVVAEVDGYGFHRGRAAFEADRRRDSALQAAGWRVLRVTGARIQHDAPVLVAELHALLSG